MKAMICNTVTKFSIEDAGDGRIGSVTVDFIDGHRVHVNVYAKLDEITDHVEFEKATRRYLERPGVMAALGDKGDCPSSRRFNPTFKTSKRWNC